LPSLSFCELLHAVSPLGAALVPLNTLLPVPEQRLQACAAGALLAERVEDWVSAAARERPGHQAVVADDGVLTYGELDEAASRAARRLAALGVCDGDRVATTLAPGAAFAALLHGAPRLGAALVPLNPGMAAADLARLRESCGAPVLVERPLGGDQADVPLRATMDPGAPHTVIHTSGTTSAPRAVALTVGNHHASALASARILGVQESDRWLCVLPLFHVGGLAILLRSAIYAITAVVHERFGADRVRSALEHGQVSLTSLVSTMLHRLREAGLETAPGLRAVLLGGGPIPQDLLDWARERGLPVAPTYGMTETASQIVTIPPADARRGERFGEPLEGVRLRIGEDGEILVRGPMVAPAEVGEDGWLHTGDLGNLDGRGRLTVAGRKKDVIVTGGENVMASRVEEALRAHPAVVDAGVAGLADAEWGERVTAWVVLGGGVSDSELTEHCRALLAPFEVPKEVRRVTELRRTATGKLLRSQLASLRVRP
jgi:O-succinylbenzoic acid--CoA ligase